MFFRLVILSLFLSMSVSCTSSNIIAKNSGQPLKETVSPTVPNNPAISFVNLNTLPQNIGLEYQDRINRFNRLSSINGIKSPRIDQLQLASGQMPGIDYAIPVIRIIFDNKVFFDFDKDILRPEAEVILNVIAENMRRDVPDVQLLVLGHTDALGTDAYNNDLSMRRARVVLAGLVARGVNSFQLKSVAIGKNQPIADNATEDGRAKNRRVEFMISANQMANIQLVQKRRVIMEYLPKTTELYIPKKVLLLSPQQLSIKAADKVASSEDVIVKNQKTQSNIVETVELQIPSSLPNIELAPIKNVEAVSLNNEFTL